MNQNHQSLAVEACNEMTNTVRIMTVCVESAERAVYSKF